MRTEREPNRYEPLNETHRRVAEDEEKRRVAEQEQARSAQSEPEPFRPGAEPRPQGPETTPDHDPDSPEARLAAKEQELQEQVRLGRINSSEMIYQLRQFDNELRVELETGRPVRPPQRESPEDRQAEPSAGAERTASETPQHAEDARDESDRARDNPSERMPERKIEREAEAAEYEITGQGEMTDARARRMERLRSIDRDIEREGQENNGAGLNHGKDTGDRSSR